MYFPKAVSAILLAASTLPAQDLDWLPPGVLYLLTEPERSQARSARNEATRQVFLKLVWRTRDPVEHERRVNYSNARFGTDALAGWKTDRGRHYIVLGPADEVHAYPKGVDASGLSQEQWRYNRAGASGDYVEYRFIDAAKDGSYPLILSSERRSALPELYAAWLDEDVAYIISPEERADFLRLRGDAERDSFIEAFWSKRNRAEHYRRFAYANERFRDKALPGWKTDRGRVYITQGPAAEIIVRPAVRREYWIYQSDPQTRYVFEDLLGDGAYTLVSSTRNQPDEKRN